MFEDLSSFFREIIGLVKVIVQFLNLYLIVLFDLQKECLKLFFSDFVVIIVIIVLVFSDFYYIIKKLEIWEYYNYYNLLFYNKKI